MNGQSGTETGINLEYWFRQIYDLLFVHSANTAALSAELVRLWNVIVLVGYIVTLIGFFIIVYYTIKLFHLREKEEEQLGTIILAPESAAGNPRWAHIESLMDSPTPSDWRQAIIEADIMLDDMLTRQGYQGAGVGEKLQKVEASDFATLQDAWEAHKVRNQIAHEGSAFMLTETLARRTIARYESVFREFGGV